MKKLSALFILISCLFLAGCQHTIAYQLRNVSDYDAVLVDIKQVNFTPYFLNAHSWVTIEHTTAGDFALYPNSDPIELINTYGYSEIRELKSFNIQVCNNTSKAFQLTVLNTTHISTKTFSINPNQNTEFKIYAKTKPVIELLNDNQKYNNYVFNDETLVIY